MKWILLGFVCLFEVLGVQGANNYTVIKGFVEGKYRPSCIQLIVVKNGVPAKYAGTSIASNGSFAFMFQPDRKGFYYLFDGANYYRFFAQGDEEINVVLSDGNFSFVEGVNKENYLLGEWQKQMDSLMDKIDVAEYGKYFVEFDSLLCKVPLWLAEHEIKNEEFKNQLAQIIELDMLNSFVSYVSKYQQRYNSDEQTSTYYQKIIKQFPICDSGLLEQPYGMDLLEKYFSYKSIFVIRDSVYSLEEQLAELHSPLLKSEYIINQVDTKDFARFCDYERKYFPLLQTDEQRYRFQHLENRPVSVLEKGELAPNFIYQDTAGVYRSVTDYSGKIKYIDIWATWCAPCKKEIPYLQNLEKKFADDEIAFISISIDNNQEKWKKFVREHHLGGIHLWAGDWNNLPKELNIGSVPRFMLIDKEGKWLEIDALRPSNPELEYLLEEILNKM